VCYTVAALQLPPELLARPSEVPTMVRGLPDFREFSFSQGKKYVTGDTKISGLFKNITNKC
jgi:hypothetical protein